MQQQAYRQCGSHRSGSHALARLVEALHGLLIGAARGGGPPLLGGCQATPSQACLALHGGAGLSPLQNLHLQRPVTDSGVTS